LERAPFQADAAVTCCNNTFLMHVVVVEGNFIVMAACRTIVTVAEIDVFAKGFAFASSVHLSPLAL
jgi:hypothetical protein